MMGDEENDDALPIKDGHASGSESDEDMGFTSAGMGPSQPSIHKFTTPKSEPPTKRLRGGVPTDSQNSQPVQLRSQSSDASFEKARSTLAEKQETFSEANLWNTKMRIRTVQHMGKQLCQLITPLSNSGGQEAEELCQQVMAFAEQTEAKFQLFDAVRKSPAASVTSLTEDQLEILRTISGPVLSSIVVWVASQLLKDIDCDQEATATARAE